MSPSGSVRRPLPPDSPLQSITSATHSGLTFDTQKNRVRGEQLAHGRSNYAVACPTTALIHRVLYLRLKQATLDTPSARFSAKTPGTR